MEGGDGETAWCVGLPPEAWCVEEVPDGPDCGVTLEISSTEPAQPVLAGYSP
jgi:hypothetical protein